MNETITTARRVNRAAVRAHALRCSENLRAGKFTRVGEDFMDEVEADVEALIREIRNRWTTTFDVVQLRENERVVTGQLLDKLQVELDNAIARLVQNKVQRQPSVGCTLRATR